MRQASLLLLNLVFVKYIHMIDVEIFWFKVLKHLLDSYISWELPNSDRLRSIITWWYGRTINFTFSVKEHALVWQKVGIVAKRTYESWLHLLNEIPTCKCRVTCSWNCIRKHTHERKYNKQRFPSLHFLVSSAFLWFPFPYCEFWLSRILSLVSQSHLNFSK